MFIIIYYVYPPLKNVRKRGEKSSKKMDQKSVKLMREKIREIGKSARKSTRMGILSHSQPFDEDGPSGRTQDEKVRIFYRCIYILFSIARKIKFYNIFIEYFYRIFFTIFLHYFSQ